ncbi:phospholipase [Goodfellowiella coeruleoviolacea]|uniref:Phospholipase A2 n=1 Tax=Goodfellowiella coeruleoviolacea TaxID=334858 RepID=A0AAE3GLG3_9PSEU|nr:phospholipase [Goodfellowiella coeruleoviolacea]MCP2169574.1 phospholipase A2 [Goodfellowiella coeruleoviolacea]
MSAATLRRASRNVLATAAVAGALFVGTGTAQAATIEQITDDYLFSKTLSQFVTLRSQTPYPDQLDWSSDACSMSPDEPLGFDFTPACWRHDFGYRNYKKQSRFTETTRKSIDDNFYADLKGICKGNSVCNGTAYVYYKAVREFGNS